MTTDESIQILNEAGVTIQTTPPASAHYNCWSFVSYILGWTSTTNWLMQEEMEYQLANNSIVIDKPEVGAIAVFRDYTGTQLQHTTLVISPCGEEMIHKPGVQALSNITKTELNSDCWTRWYNRLVEYRRAIISEV